MIEIAGFIDLHTHTRYPDDQKFPFIDIDDSAINGGFSTILAMPNSEIPIDSIKNLKIAEEIDKKLKTKVHRVASLTKNLEAVFRIQTLLNVLHLQHKLLGFVFH